MRTPTRIKDSRAIQDHCIMELRDGTRFDHAIGAMRHDYMVVASCPGNDFKDPVVFDTLDARSWNLEAARDVYDKRMEQPDTKAWYVSAQKLNEAFEF